MDRPEAGTVAGSHVGVERIDGICSGQLTVLLVHVVCTGARVVADPDTEVLDLDGVLLVELNCKTVRLNVLISVGRRFLLFRLLTVLMLTISPVAFLTFLRPRMKYQ